MKPVTVFSAFDGAGIGLLALKRAGVPIAAYYASEVDKYAMQVAKKNHPEIIHVGDVKQCYARNFPKIDLLIGGSPCQDLSSAKTNREGLKGTRSGLFWHFVRLLRTMKPRFFLLENVASMSKEDKAKITEIMGVEPILINSALVSAQQRKRLYWTNIPGVTQPKDKGILIKDILERANPEEAVLYNRYNQSTMKEKSAALGTNPQCETSKTGQVVLSPVRIGTLKGLDTGQTNRIYSVRGKSVCLNAGGWGGGAQTGLYKIDLPDGDYTVRKLTPVECERLQTWPDNYTETGQSCYCYNINDIITLATKGGRLCKNVKLINAKVQLKLELSNLKMVDTFLISSTQRYKIIGNGWTADVIAHIFKFIKG